MLPGVWSALHRSHPWAGRRVLDFIAEPGDLGPKRVGHGPIAAAPCRFAPLDQVPDLRRRSIAVGGGSARRLVGPLEVKAALAQSGRHAARERRPVQRADGVERDDASLAEAPGLA